MLAGLRVAGSAANVAVNGAAGVSYVINEEQAWRPPARSAVQDRVESQPLLVTLRAPVEDTTAGNEGEPDGSWK